MPGSKFDIPVRFEDDAVLVVSKPAGLVVHPGAGNYTGTLVDWLEQRNPEIRKAGDPRAGLLHRLDKDTSGLVLVAKTLSAKENLTKQFSDRTVLKRYQALVVGIPEQAEGKIDAPITRHHADRKKMTVRPDGKSAETRYKVVKELGAYSLLDVWIATGRTHQIRVHLAALHHPVVGDATYGEAAAGLGRQFLHAVELEFTHPETGKRVNVIDELSDDLKEFLHGLDTE